MKSNIDVIIVTIIKIDGKTKHDIVLFVVYTFAMEEVMTAFTLPQTTCTFWSSTLLYYHILISKSKIKQTQIT